jgi:5-methyltetrahydrofolate corrinoid/iron sulfur protein methyltransferase
MLRVGENLNVMIKKIGAAMKEKDPKPIQELAIAEAKAGVNFIDINLGPARKGGGELMESIPLFTSTPSMQRLLRLDSRSIKTKRGRLSSIRSWPVLKVWT